MFDIKVKQEPMSSAMAEPRARPLDDGAGPAPIYARHAEREYLFSDLCTRFEEIAAAAGKQQRVAVLERLWVALKDSDYYPFMRLVVPQLDTQRATYGLKESKIAKYYIELLGLSPNSPDAERFRNWRDPSKNNVEATHFSDVVFVVLTKRAYTSQGTLTVSDVNQHLDHLASSTHVDAKKATLMALLRSTSALEQKWLIRVITKEMKMHLQHTGILAAFHPTALELYNNTNDLAYVCRKCTDPKELVSAGDMKTGIFLMQPLKPMLASVVESAKLSVLLKDERLFVEPKYDGERMMIHKNGDAFMYWTRNARNYTAQYAPKFDAVLKAQLGAHVQNCILDGEFLLYDDTTKRFHEFGHNRTFATSGVDFSDVDGVKQWFCYCVFDIVFLNGESLVTLPLSKRKDVLKTIVMERPTMIELVQHTVATSIKSILGSLDAALASHHEGILIKVAASQYVPGERKLKWLKLKPDHIAGMADTVDLVILGGYYGTKYGVRHVSHFLLGVWVNQEGSTPLASDARYHTLCKVGSGYSEDELNDLLAALSPKWMTMSSVPPWLDGWVAAADDLPDVWVHPKDSVVMEVYGYSFTETTKFRVGQTIRFPRCRRIRHDKDVADATDLANLKTIMSQSGLFSKKAEAIDELVTVRQEKRQRKADENTRKRTLPERTFARAAPTIMVPDATKVERLSTIFEGYEVCVLYASPDVMDKHSMETLLIAHSAHIVANPTPLTSLLLSTSSSAQKVRNWIQECERNAAGMSSKYPSIDIIRHSWALECIAARTVLPLAPRFMVYASPGLRERFAVALDAFNDSYEDDATVETLRESCALAIAAMPGAAVPASGTEATAGAPSTAAQRTSLDAVARATRTIAAWTAELGVADDRFASAVASGAVSSVPPSRSPNVFTVAEPTPRAVATAMRLAALGAVVDASCADAAVVAPDGTLRPPVAV